MFLALYSLLMTLGQPLLRRKLKRRGVAEPGYLEAVDERFGRYTQPAEARAELVWIHAVSFGETRTTALLLDALRAAHPGLRLLLTHGTATGRAEGVALLREGDVQVWQPWDSPRAVARFFDHFKPRLGLLMETEVWPNLVAQAARRALPLLVVNGRLSQKSLDQSLRLSPIALPAFGALTAVYAQTESDAQRFVELGAPLAGIFGNLKFDATPAEALRLQGKLWRSALDRPVLMFASSREGEEEAFFRLLGASGRERQVDPADDDAGRRTGAPPRILVVPRHPQRFNEVEALARKHGLTVSRRSGWSNGPAASAEALAADVWLGDTLGEMALYYALSDVALLGGSFEPLGGQNLIEAAACGCPVVMGPHTFNFSEAAELSEQAGSARRVADLEQGLDAAVQLARDLPAQATAAAAGLAFAAAHRGATARTLAALEPYLRQA